MRGPAATAPSIRCWTRVARRVLCACAVAAVVALLLSYFTSSLNKSGSVAPKLPKRDPGFQNKLLSDTNMQKTSKKAFTFQRQGTPQKVGKKILLWTPFWRSFKFYDHVFTRLREQDCPISACHITADRSQLESADVVVFHVMDFTKSTELPRHRPLKQPWLAYVIEAPPVTSQNNPDVERLRGVVNWTMSYRRDSDVVAPYGVVVRRDAPETWRRDYDYWKQKTQRKMAAWMVSNCKTHSRRENFVAELKKHMTVDVYGKCGSLKCGLSLTDVIKGKTKSSDCDEVVNDYFFYLAFENALCLDYVTEKFFLALTRSVVPVVFGGADYASVAPPHSYINALDYDSPRQLAKALSSIASNRTLYNSYFAWKADYTVDLGDPIRPHVCDLCAKLHGAPLQHTGLRRTTPENKPALATPNLSHWTETSSCQQWNIPKA